MLFHRISAATIPFAMLAACSGEPAGDGQAQTVPADPPGAANALSLGSQIGTSQASAYDRAVDCAVALAVTARTLAPMTTGAGSREVRLINIAAERFRAEARSEADGDANRVRADIESKTMQSAQDRQGQAQLSIACLRSIEDQF